MDLIVIEYVLKIWNNGDDGFQFKLVIEVGSCMNLELFFGILILVGFEKELISLLFDLGSLVMCINIVVDVLINDIEVNEVDVSVEFIVSLFVVSGVVVMVDYVIQLGSVIVDEDFIVVIIFIIIMFNLGVISQQILILILEDNLLESEEIFDVVLSNVNNVILDKFSGRVIILDNEISFCGMLLFDLVNDQNIYLWKDCGMDNWYLFVIVGGFVL